MTTTLILASASPRRRELLTMLEIPFDVRPSHIEEVRRPGEAPRTYAERLAKEKALNAPGELVLGADTIVLMGETLLEKPRDEADALRMLRLLQGRSHEVISAVALVAKGKAEIATDVTRVTFRPAD